MDALVFTFHNSTSLLLVSSANFIVPARKQLLLSGFGSLTLETGRGRVRGKGIGIGNGIGGGRGRGRCRGRGRGRAITLLPIIWRNANAITTSSSLSESAAAAADDQVEDCSREPGHELPLVEKILQKSYQDIGMGHRLDLANEENLLSLQGSVDIKMSSCCINKVEDRKDSADIAGEMREAGAGTNGKRRYLEEEAEEKGTGKLFVTNTEVQELGHEVSIVNQMSMCSEVYDTKAVLQISNEAPKNSSVRSSISFPTEEPSSHGNLCSAGKDDSTGNSFGVDILRSPRCDVNGKGHNNLIVCKYLEDSFSSNENSDMPEPESSDGASLDHPKSEIVESNSQQSLYHGSHEGSLLIRNSDEMATSNITEKETTVIFVKKEACDSSVVGNGPAIGETVLVAGAKMKRVLYKSHGHSTYIGVKLKDLLPVDSTKDVSEYMRYYDCWLRVGRFKDCLELLECMNKVGALDMNKVYHSKFFEICREKQAVQEAFRFVKLIDNPTLSTFNMLLAVCASAKDVGGAFQVLPLVKKMGLKADCKLYTALISSCAKGGKVDIMFKVFHEMVNAGIEPNFYTYGALIDGCARSGQVAKAFGVYGIMRSKKMKPDRVVFNALITACGRAGAVDRAFDILSEMTAEPRPLDPDHVTVGALINACLFSGQVDRALEVYKMIQQHGIKGTAHVYTMAVGACSQNGDLDFALSVYDDMRKNGVRPDEVFFSALIDVAGHAGDIGFGFKILRDAKNQGLKPGSVMYSSLMGACSNAKNWQKALELYEEIKIASFVPTVSTFNALITSLCDVGKLRKSIEILEEMKQARVLPSHITYNILLIASHKEDEPELALNLFSSATMDGVVPNLTMCDCVTSLCLQRFRKASMVVQSIACYDSGGVQIRNQWTSWALLVYRQTISAGVTPTMEALSHVLGCLRMPFSAARNISHNENLGFQPSSTKRSNLCSLIDGFGIYDPRAFSLYEEAASLGVVPCFPYKDAPVTVDARDLHVYVAEVYLLTILKGLKHRLAAGARVSTITVLLPAEKVVVNSKNVQTLVSVSGRTGQAVANLLRRLNLSYQGNEAYGKIRITGKAIKHWLRPKYNSLPFPTRILNSHLAKGIGHQQCAIRTQHLCIDDDDKSKGTQTRREDKKETFQAKENR